MSLGDFATPELGNLLWQTRRAKASCLHRLQSLARLLPGKATDAGRNKVTNTQPSPPEGDTGYSAFADGNEQRLHRCG
jgi:hypothetical protein